MDICGNMFRSDVLEKDNFDEKMYDLILYEFLDSIGVDFIWDNLTTSGEIVRDLKYEFVYTSEYNELFFEILAKYNYNMKYEIKDAMYYLGHLKNPSVNAELIKRLLGSTIIKDISFNGRNIFTISTEQYGDFVFELAAYYFRGNQKMANYIKKNQLPRRCHTHAYFMSKVFVDFYAITSLCQSYFGNSYHHSYTFDSNRDVIIDLCYNAVVDEGQYYNLFQPQDISVILNSKVAEELALTELKTNQEQDRCELLKIALYKQYLDSIGYQGSLEDAPSICPKKKIKGLGKA